MRDDSLICKSDLYQTDWLRNKVLHKKSMNWSEKKLVFAKCRLGIKDFKA